MRIVVIGYSGAGKSTLSNLLHERYHFPLLYLDQVQFLAEWKERDLDEAKNLVSTFMKQTDWIMDGNYKDLYLEERIQLADKIIILSYPRLFCLYRAYKRYLQNRGKTRVSMQEGCVEKFDMEFIWWLLYEGRKQKKVFQRIKKEYGNKTWECTNAKQLRMYIDNECW